MERGRTLIGVDVLLAVCRELGRPVTYFVGGGVVELGDVSDETVLMPLRAFGLFRRAMYAVDGPREGTVLMPLRAFGLFRRVDEEQLALQLLRVLMPLRAFGLFRRKAARKVALPTPIRLNALTGVRSIPTLAAWWGEHAIHGHQIWGDALCLPHYLACAPSLSRFSPHR